MARKETTTAESKPQTALAEKDPAAPLLKTMELMRPQFEMALPRHLDADRFYRVALTCLRTNPKLVKADRGSLLASLMQAAQLGLEPDGLLGHGFLIPYGDKVQFQPGYKGYLALARNSGEMTYFHADFVLDGDLFEYEHGTNAKLRHVPGPNRSDPKKKLLYAYCHSKGRGGEVFVVLDESEVLARRDRSQGYRAAVKYGKDSPWKTDEAAMWTKTAIRAWAKHGPQSVQRAAEIEDAADRGLIPRQVFEGSMDIVMEPLEEPAETTAGKLDSFVAKKAAPPTEQPSGGDLFDSAPISARRTLTTAQVEHISMVADELGVPISEVEEAWGCALVDVQVDEGDAETEVLAWMHLKAKGGQ
jgi:recombination protein RecT